MYLPAQHDEVTTLANYIDQQLEAIRAAAFGLTEEQARATPCRSALSISGILKHTAHGMRAVTRGLIDGPNLGPLDEAAFAGYLGSFALTGEETTESTLAEFDAARAEYLAAIRASDPDADTVSPPQPWYGIFQATPIKTRFQLAHQVEEMARHAGHADIIREEIDGQAVPGLVMTLAGAPANDFFTPYVPEPGTIGAS